MRLRWMLTGLLALAMVMAISPALAQDAAEEETAVDPDVQAVRDALTAVIDSVTSFDEDAIKAAFSERSVVVLSFMGVRVLDRAGLIDFVRYENVSQAEFGEVEVTMFDGLAFVTVPITVPGYADGAMFGVMAKMMGKWQIVYSVIDPMSNMIPTSRKDKGEAMIEQIAEEFFTGLQGGSLEALTSRLSEEHACLIASIPPMAPMVFNDYNQIMNALPMAEPVLAAFPTPEVLESDYEICNGVLLGWCDLQLPKDVVMRAYMVALVQGEEASIINGTLAFKGDVMALVAEYGPAAGVGN
ncbi:MAG: nuclear transport factor 2 family protein [Acidobacteriota bacterium]|nr:nuclear transport factor 2 family protein [Acidobacteriota bacterium]NLN88895.1 nuclear transport factor 2 family protein [candidate division WS1 bacterium]